MDGVSRPLYHRGIKMYSGHLAIVLFGGILLFQWLILCRIDVTWGPEATNCLMDLFIQSPTAAVIILSKMVKMAIGGHLTHLAVIIGVTLTPLDI